MAPSDSGSFSDGTSVCSNYALTLGKLEPFPNSFFFLNITLFHVMFHIDFLQFDNYIWPFFFFLLSKAMVCYFVVAGIFIEFK